jgi:uncharacterized protein
MIILLPPSEGKSTATGNTTLASDNPALASAIQPILKHLKTLKGDAIGKFYSIKDSDKAKAVHKQNLSLFEAGCIPAIERYTGVVYSYIDYPSLAAKKRAQKSIYIVSGLFGLVGEGTMLPEYKAPLNTWLRHYWYEKNTEYLKTISSHQTVLSLLPQSYAKALDIQDALHVDFKVAGGKKLAGHFGKAIKGKFVRFLIENNVQSAKDFAAFNEDNFVFDGEHFVQP